MSSPYLSIWTGAEVDEGIRRAYENYERLSRIYEGTWDLESGIDYGVVSGLDLSFVPTKIQLTLEIPQSGLHIFACCVHNTMSADGFAFKLSSLTDGINYRLHYTLVGDDQGESST